MLAPQRVDPGNLVESHRSYARALAAQILRPLPARVDRREIEAAAEFGLVEAAAAFDAGRGVQFKTFAYYRIRGAVYDCLRKMLWIPASARQDLASGARSNAYLQDAAETPEPEDAEAAGRDLERLVGSFVSSCLLSLESLKTELAAAESTPEESAQAGEDRRRLLDALQELPRNNRLVIEEYYFRDRSLEDIGRMLNLSKSWVCRMHARSLEMLREKLRSMPARVQATFSGGVR